jgi:hypothetical protein
MHDFEGKTSGTMGRRPEAATGSAYGGSFTVGWIVDLVFGFCFTCAVSRHLYNTLMLIE